MLGILSNFEGNSSIGRAMIFITVPITLSFTTCLFDDEQIGPMVTAFAGRGIAPFHLNVRNKRSSTVRYPLCLITRCSERNQKYKLKGLTPLAVKQHAD